jgi:cell wall-associated NlpC family hydrolase
LRTSRRLLRTVLFGVVAVGVMLPVTAAVAAPSQSQLQAQIDKAANQLEDIVERYNAVTEQLGQSQAAAADLQARMAPLQARLDAAYVNIQTLAVTAYKGGKIGTMNVLLNSGSGGTFFDSLTSLDQIARTQQRTIGSFTDLKKQYQGDQDKLNALLAQQAAQQKDLASTRTKIEADLAKLQDMKKRAGTTTSSGSSGGGGARPAPPWVPGRAGIAVNYAYAHLGDPYVFAAAGPRAFDCSGLTMAAWKAAGVSLPHNAAMQWGKVAHISRAALQPGDLVFYRSLGHVALYVGGGKVIHAPHAGTDVQIASVDIMKPYGYGRPG